MQIKKIKKHISGAIARVRLRPFDSASILYLLAGLLAFAACMLIVWFAYGQLAYDRTGNSIVSPQVYGDEEREALCEHMRLIDGVCVEHEEDTVGQYIAVMVENHYEANPLSGIAEASVVYEAPVEGHIPRFLALYPIETEVEKVGPVRSARPYYLDWVSEYGDAMYMHVGGSPEALEKIWVFGLFDMNEFSRGWYYWRASNRNAPHNTYTSNKLWSEAATRYEDDSYALATEGWRFGLMDACDSSCVTRIDIEQSVGGYDIAWEYVSTTRQYERTQFGRTHADADGDAYVADTILLQRVEAEVVDGVGRLHIDTIGEGDGYVFRDGHAIAATWKKENRTAKTRWFNAEGREIALKPGKIWVQVVSQFGSVDVTVE
jgi:hypothetical protein